MHRSLRDNGLFRSSSNYRVDNEGFDSKKPSLPLLRPPPSPLLLWPGEAARPFQGSQRESDGLEARWRKEKNEEEKMKRGGNGRVRGESWGPARPARGGGRKRGPERKATEFWPVARKPRRQMRTSEPRIRRWVGTRREAVPLSFVFAPSLLSSSSSSAPLPPRVLLSLFFPRTRCIPQRSRRSPFTERVCTAGPRGAISSTVSQAKRAVITPGFTRSRASSMPRCSVDTHALGVASLLFQAFKEIIGGVRKTLPGAATPWKWPLYRTGLDRRFAGAQGTCRFALLFVLAFE